jgi:glycosyltransferase involved in cell wall biosynthesis
VSEPLVSVIIPAHNGGALLADAVRSVLGQTYARLELLVVDDASHDRSREALAHIGDRRLRCLVHAENRGAHAARLTGLQASSGEIVAFLDQDDYFHPGKLEAHVSYLRSNPDIGLSYNPHFVVTHPPGHVAGIWRPPARVAIGDLLLGFPIAPSMWVLRREWASRDELWDEPAMRRGAEAVVCSRLIFAGCRFGLVDRTLNFRRIHLGRRFSDPIGKCREERSCHEVVLADPRCPTSALSFAEAAAVNNYLVWANVALAQTETAAGLALLEEALKLDPTLARGAPTRVAEFVLSHAVLESRFPESQLRSIFSQLRPRFQQVTSEVDWAVTQACLIQGTGHVLWERPEEAQRCFARAVELGATVDDAFLRRLAFEVRSYEIEFGTAAAGDALTRLGAALAAVGGAQCARRLQALYHLQRAFDLHALGERRGVVGSLVRGMLGHPQSLANRGAWSILRRTASPRWLSS